MKKTLKYIFQETKTGRYFSAWITNLYFGIQTLLVSDRIILKKRYFRKFGKELNLDNPRTFNEKLTWLKLNDRTIFHTGCADKLEVRDYVRVMIGKGYLIPLVFESDDINDVAPENFPDDMPFILKTNHDSGGGIVVKNKFGVGIDWFETRRKLQVRLLKNYYYRSKEWQYRDIDRKIIAEKLLMDENGNTPNDYKFHCFNGKVKFIQVDIDRDTDHRRNLYDTDWELIPCRYVYKNGKHVERPKVLNKMIELAETLSVNFKFARIDFYNIGEKIYFGEITFHPESGTGKFFPEYYDLKFGEYLELKN